MCERERCKKKESSCVCELVVKKKRVVVWIVDMYIYFFIAPKIPLLQ